MNDLERTAHETEALRIAIDLRMTHGAGAAAFRAALAGARGGSRRHGAHFYTSPALRALYARAGGLLVELGVLSEADALDEQARAEFFLSAVKP